MFDDWLTQNQKEIRIMFHASRSDIVWLFASYAAKNYKKLGVSKNIDELCKLIREVCNFYSGAPERTYKAVVDRFGFVWPSFNGDKMFFDVSREQHNFNVLLENQASDLHSNIYTKMVQGKNADQYLEMQRQLEEAKKKSEDVVRYLKYKTFDAYHYGQKLTLIKPCSNCGELVPVSARHYQIKAMQNVQCGQCFEDDNTIKELKKEKAELNKLTKKLKESIKNENE